VSVVGEPVSSRGGVAAADAASAAGGGVNAAGAAAVVALRAAGQTVATAESLTGGLVCSALVDMPGASAVVRGGVVAYATELKHALLGVDAGLLEARGPVDPDVAQAMAEGIRSRLAATWGLATTGVAGPNAQDGAPPGRVFVAVAGPDGVRVRRLDVPGGRADVRHAARDAVLALFLERLGVSAG